MVAEYLHADLAFNHSPFLGRLSVISLSNRCFKVTTEVTTEVSRADKLNQRVLSKLRDIYGNFLRILENKCCVYNVHCAHVTH